MITHPEKVLFPDDGITKGELAAYYEAIAPVMVPHIRGGRSRWSAIPPASARRVLPEGRVEGLSGVARARRGAEEGRDGAPSARERHAVAAVAREPEHASRRTCGRRARRICITPTSASSTSIRPEDEPDALRAAALGAARSAGRAGLPSWVKTSGSKGFHIVVPLDGKSHDGRGRRGSRTPSARCWSRAIREHLTQEFSKADRGGRILVDTGRNGYSATFAAAYAVRAEARRAGLGAVHVGGSRARRRRAADVHAADDGRAGRRRSATSGPTCANAAARCDGRSNG